MGATEGRADVALSELARRCRAIPGAETVVNAGAADELCSELARAGARVVAEADARGSSRGLVACFDLGAAADVDGRIRALCGLGDAVLVRPPGDGRDRAVKGVWAAGFAAQGFFRDLAFDTDEETLCFRKGAVDAVVGAYEELLAEARRDAAMTRAVLAEYAERLKASEQRAFALESTLASPALKLAHALHTVSAQVAPDESRRGRLVRKLVSGVRAARWLAGRLKDDEGESQ